MEVFLMGVWGLDIYDDDLAADLKEEFQGYIDEGMEEDDAIEELMNNNDNLLDDDEDKGTFILTLAALAKEYQVNNPKVKKMLNSLSRCSRYWNSIKEESQDLYDARWELFRELI